MSEDKNKEVIKKIMDRLGKDRKLSFSKEEEEEIYIKINAIVQRHHTVFHSLILNAHGNTLADIMFLSNAYLSLFNEYTISLMFRAHLLREELMNLKKIQENKKNKETDYIS